MQRVGKYILRPKSCVVWGGFREISVCSALKEPATKPAKSFCWINKRQLSQFTLRSLGPDSSSQRTFATTSLKLHRFSCRHPLDCVLRFSCPPTIGCSSSFLPISAPSNHLEPHIRSLPSAVRFSTNSSVKMSEYKIVERGAENTSSYRVYYTDSDGQSVSPFHDIPMFADEANNVFNMVVEVPRWTNAKMEIATGEPLNPIKQDVKKEQLRFVKNCFPHHGYIWNYGAIPQTWEDPNKTDSNTGCKGDNDPIDICEIGHRVCNRGDVIQVKVLGVLALIDEGETDWKLIGIDIRDPMAAELNDVEDVEKLMPGLLKATVEWFKIYKIPDGKPANEFAFNGEVKNRAFAETIIAETHHHWVDLMNSDTTGKINCSSVSQTSSQHKITPEEANSIVSSTPEFSANPDREDIIDKWYYVSA